MANLLRLTGELGNFGFWIDGPEIWPSQKGVGGWGRAGGALPPTLSSVTLTLTLIKNR